ncbi:MAG: hypothetical protein HUU08_08415 [Candidatus Brocadia sp.]|nr:hypothetical protein [Candidatus Brocadia sp.]
MNKIGSIVIEYKPNEYPDTSIIGEYTNIFEKGVIVRLFGKFYKDLTEKELKKAESHKNNKGNIFYAGFKPYASGEKMGTELYKKYGMRDYKHMEALGKGKMSFHWHKSESASVPSK